MAGPPVELMFLQRGNEGVAAQIDLDHGRMKPDDYTRLYAEFIRAAGCKAANFVQMHTLYPDQVKDDVWWSTALCPDGARITLIVEPNVSRDDYLGVRRWLQNKHDVVSFRTLRIDRWITFKHTYVDQNLSPA